MPEIVEIKPGALNTNSSGCLKEGLIYAAVAKKSYFNLGSMKDDTALFDKTKSVLKGFVFNDETCKFNPVKFDKRTSNLTSQWTKAECVYIHTLILRFLGKDCDQTKTIKDWIQACQLVLVIWTADCVNGRVLGFEYDAGTDEFDNHEEGLEMNRHDDNHSQKGSGTPPYDEIELTARADSPAIWFEGSIADFKQNYLNA